MKLKFRVIMSSTFWSNVLFIVASQMIWKLFGCLAQKLYRSKLSHRRHGPESDCSFQLF